MNANAPGTRRRLTLPALGAAALVAGLCLAPVAAIAATLDGSDPVETVEVRADLSEMQLPTLSEEAPLEAPVAQEALPVAPESSQGSGPIAEFTATTGRITGIITDAAGQPLANAYAGVYNGNDYVTSAATNAAGVYATSELPPGDYTLMFWKDGHAGEYWNDSHLSSGQTLIHVVAGQDVTASAELATGSTISGTVRYADGMPATGYRVAVHWPDNYAGYTLTTVDAAGGFGFDNLWPWDVAVRVIPPTAPATTIGWMTDSPALSPAQVIHDIAYTGTDLHFAVFLPFLADGTPAEPEVPEEPTDPTDPTDECTEATIDPVTGETVECDHGGEPTGCTDPLTGQVIDCAPIECRDPLGNVVTCDTEECRDPLGNVIECPETWEPECEYMCDEPDLSTVPEYPDTELTTLALTGSGWSGVAVVAGTLTLLGGGLFAAARWAARDRLMAR